MRKIILVQLWHAEAHQIILELSEATSLVSKWGDLLKNWACSTTLCQFRVESVREVHLADVPKTKQPATSHNTQTRQAQLHCRSTAHEAAQKKVKGYVLDRKAHPEPFPLKIPTWKMKGCNRKETLIVTAMVFPFHRVSKDKWATHVRTCPRGYPLYSVHNLPGGMTRVHPQKFDTVLVIGNVSDTAYWKEVREALRTVEIFEASLYLCKFEERTCIRNATPRRIETETRTASGREK